MEGLIIKAISGFYYVEAEGKLFECKARGVFRKMGISPAAGDRVRISPLGEDKANVEEILPRKNYLVRPPLANLDTLFIVSSVTEPSPSTLIIDKISAVAVSKGIEPVIVFTKSDLGDASQYLDIYRSAGIKAFEYSTRKDSDRDSLIALFDGKISAFTGNTGVGKSSLLNSLFPGLEIETSEISRKLGRGRHTTRHSELYKLGGGYVADTPGFSTVDIERYEIIRKNEIASCFPEFADHIGECMFTGCSHTVEKGCAVLQAVKDGDIPRSRHDSYRRMYDEVKNIPEWK